MNMTLSRKTLVWVAIPVVGLSATGIWAADSAAQRDSRPGCMGGMIRRFVAGQIGRLAVLRSDLNITDEQRSEIRGIVQGHRSEIAPVVQKIVEKRRALRAAVLADSPDEKTIRAAADDLGKAIGDAGVLASKVAGEVRPALTQEQRDRIGKFRQDREAATDAWLQKLLGE
jgi:Spy/CpxP family protein refolding chaperone